MKHPHPSSHPTAADRRHLQRAVELGRRGWGRVHPNPMVGCVVVQDGAVTGEGWHRVYGGPHAEVHALEEAGARARGATLYVSLEPCRHEGQTPACTAAIRQAGIRRVVFGATDPTRQAGGGAAELRQDGLEVVGPLLTPAEARRENPAFFHHAHSGRPWLALKLALSLDGRIAAAPGKRTAVTGPETRTRVHALRAGFDAVMIGSRTAAVDDPLLTVREDVPVQSQPSRVVLDSSLRISPRAALFKDLEIAPLVIFTRTDAPTEAVRSLEAAGATVHPVPGAASGSGLELENVLGVCAREGLRSVLCEGGGRLARSLLAADVVERMHLFWSPLVLGPEGVPGFPCGRSDPSLPSESKEEADEAADALRDRWEPAGAPLLHGRDVEARWERVRPWSHGGSGERMWEPEQAAPAGAERGGG